jgi:hypothetical protein
MKLVQIAALLILILLSACIQENPNLVNPPPFRESVTIKFLNLSSDKSPRTLVLNKTKSIIDAPFSVIPKAINPPADSAQISIEKGTIVDFTLSVSVKFSRATDYTLIALPSPYGAARKRQVDTILMLSTMVQIPLVQMAWINVFNAFPDSSVSYNVTIGCPSGQALANSITYRSQTALAQIRSGSVPISLIRKGANGDSLIHLYQINLTENRQYSLIILDNGYGSEELKMIDQFDTTAQALHTLPIISDRITRIRAINFASSNVDIVKRHGDYIASSIQSNYISEYKSLTTCDSSIADEILTIKNGDTASRAFVSLDVLENYTALVFDSSTNSIFTLITKPLHLTQNTNDSAIVRVVNGDSRYSGITVSLGASDDFRQYNRFSSGSVLAKELLFGNISNPAIVAPGITPITIFTSSEPSKLLFATLANLQANKSYLLIVTHDLNEGLKTTLIEDSEENHPVNLLQEGVFTEFVHAVPGMDTISLAVSPVLTNALLFYSGSLATVLPEGSNTIYFNGHDITFTATKNDRVLIIAAGNLNNIDIIPLISPSMGAGSTNFYRRFINACQDAPFISVNLDSETDNLIASRVAYQSASTPEMVNQELKFSLFFKDSDKDSTLRRIEDIYLSFGKNYSIIFGGSKKNKGYSVIIQQEF